LKLPNEVRDILRRRFDSRHRDWLADDMQASAWPLEIPLGVPTEQAARNRLDATRAWVDAWQRWQGSGELQWTERRWRTLGTQRLPELLRLDDARQVAIWLNENERWDRAYYRQTLLEQRWPVLKRRLGRLFAVLADYTDADFERLVATLAWLERHPDSKLYLRQLPIPGLDTKWVETRKAVLSELLCCITDRPVSNDDFFALCGLRRPPQLVRMRILDPTLRAQLGGLSDLAASVDELERLQIEPKHVVVVENLQTGLALTDLPGAVAFMALGYGVDILARLPWIRTADCLYWGDIDTHGLAILSRLRSHLPAVRSILMDEATLLAHRAFWSHEPDQHGAQEMSHLLPAEQSVYQTLKSHALGPAVRLEQERIAWTMAWDTLGSAINTRL